MKPARALIFRCIISAGAAFSLCGQTPNFQPTFSVKTTSVSCTDLASPVAGDFNGDQKLDLLLPCRTSHEIIILLGRGDGTFAASTSALKWTTFWDRQLLVADINGDGKSDVVSYADGPSLTSASCRGGTIGRGSNRIGVSLSTGNDFGAPILSQPSLYGLRAVTDFDGDGVPDVLADGSDTGAAIMAGAKDGTLAAPVPIRAGECADTSVVVDLNQDGHPDIVTLGQKSDSTFSHATLSTFINQGNSSFAPGTKSSIEYPAGPESNGILKLSAADFDADQRPDIVADVPTQLAHFMYVYHGNAAGGFDPFRSTVMLSPSQPISLLDIDGDGRADFAQEGTAGLVFYLSDPAATFPKVVTPSVSGAQITGDFDSDGKTDFAYFDGAKMNVFLNTTPSGGVNAALNGASFATGQPIAPGSLASLFGAGLATGEALASEIPLPLSLANASVTVAGAPAPLLYASAKQINFQVPWSVPAGAADIVVTVNGAPLAAFKASVAAVAPGIFSVGSGTGAALAINADGSLAAPEGSIPGSATHPAAPGDTLVIFTTGLGAVTPAPTTGAASGDALRNTIVKPKVLVGGVSAHVDFSGLSPQFVGIDQLNVVVPKGADGVVSLQLEAGGIRTTDKVTIAVKKP